MRCLVEGGDLIFNVVGFFKRNVFLEMDFWVLRGWLWNG